MKKDFSCKIFLNWIIKIIVCKKTRAVENRLQYSQRNKYINKYNNVEENLSIFAIQWRSLGVKNHTSPFLCKIYFLKYFFKKYFGLGIIYICWINFFKNTSIFKIKCIPYKIQFEFKRIIFYTFSLLNLISSFEKHKRFFSYQEYLQTKLNSRHHNVANFFRTRKKYFKLICRL